MKFTPKPYMMDSQLLPPLPTTITTTANHHADSGESSPLSRDAWEDQLPPIPGGAKLRLMCSYGGHIIPRPHDKSLCYVGGDTRIVVVDRHSSLSNLSSRLSRTLLNGRPFTLKYQLPTEDLDSLVSVTTDEDLENMIEEYDRTMSSSPQRPSRLRLFIFFLKPETATSMGSLLDDAKSETWFVDALNSTGLIPRGLSDSATMDCLLNLDDNNQLKDLEPQGATAPDNHDSNKINPPAVIAHSMPDSPMVENSSSFGSSSSSPSMSNLPPIRVRVEDRAMDHKVPIDEEFAQLNMSSAHPPPTIPMSTPPTDQNMTNHRGYSDDERSDQGVPVGFRKPPLPLQPLQHNKPAGSGGPPAGFSLPSPDSVTSECSITSANSFSKPTLYQDNKDPASPSTKAEVSDPSSQIQTQQQVQDPNYMLLQQQQQQFVHYIPHTAPSGAMPVPSYYQVYAPPQQQQQQQYPVYVMPMSHPQSYNMSMQSDRATSRAHPMASPSPAAHTNIMVQPEMTGVGAYSTAAAASTPLLQVPTNQFQQQFVSYAQVHNQPQSIAVPPPSGTANYGYEYAHPDQVYYAQSQHPVAAPLPPSQYQTMTPATMAALADAAKQMPMQ